MEGIVGCQHGNKLLSCKECLPNQATFVTKDSGKKEEFKSGYRRDTQEGKTRYDLIPTEPLKRLAGLYGRGAVLYGESNWKLGAPFSRMYASMLRHLIQFREGDKSEDHLAALSWGLLLSCIMKNK